MKQNNLCMMGAAAKPYAYTKRRIFSFNQARSYDASGVLIAIEDKAKTAFVP